MASESCHPNGMRGRRLVLALAILLVAAFGLAGQGLVSKLEILLQLAGGPVAASAAVFSEHELEEINAMPPQDQAMRLVERTINHYRAPARRSKSARRAGWGRFIR